MNKTTTKKRKTPATSPTVTAPPRSVKAELMTLLGSLLHADSCALAAVVQRINAKLQVIAAHRELYRDDLDKTAHDLINRLTDANERVDALACDLDPESIKPPF